MAKNQKVLPINKYSIYELKAGIDKEIQTYLGEEDFEEIQKFSNIKILFGLLTVTCTGTAYLYPLPFPQNYYIILFSVIGYLIFSTIYWYIDKKIIDTIFYVGKNEDYCHKLRSKKPKKISEIRIHSDIEDAKKHIYKLWFDFILEDGQKHVSDKFDFNCTEIYDERGYIHKEKAIKIFKPLLKEQVSKV